METNDITLVAEASYASWRGGARGRIIMSREAWERYKTRAIHAYGGIPWDGITTSSISSVYGARREDGSALIPADAIIKTSTGQTAIRGDYTPRDMLGTPGVPVSLYPADPDELKQYIHAGFARHDALHEKTDQ